MDERQSYRHELKYVVSSAQAVLLRQRLAGLMRPDPHAGRDGSYTVRSLYLDDWDGRCFYENEAGVDPREKYRVRIYNHSPDRILLERKRKERQLTRKAGCPLTPAQARRIAEGGVLSPGPDQPALLRLLAADVRRRRLRPAVIVEYDRIPFVHRAGNVRVTLDMNVSSSACFDGFFNEVIPRRPVLPEGRHILEVKFDGFLPDFLYRSLQLDDMQRTAYSKFYYCRKFQLR